MKEEKKTLTCTHPSPSRVKKIKNIYVWAHPLPFNNQ
jgi:hypothetical protein